MLLLGLMASWIGPSSCLRLDVSGPLGRVVHLYGLKALTLATGRKKYGGSFISGLGGSSLMMMTSVELSATFSLEVETLASMALRGLALIGHGDSSDTPFALSMEVSLKVSDGVVL